MVQTISLADTKEITPQNTKNVKLSSDSNVDFLELLMNDLKLDNSSDSEKDLSKLDDKDKKILKDLEDKLDLKDLTNNKNLKSLMDSNPQIKEDVVKEVKNILDSKMKQNNILLSKSDEKEFKSIDNLKDLMKFADKKGLNIQNIKFELPKETKNKLSNFDDKNQMNSKEESKNNIKQPRIDTKNILEKKQTNTTILKVPIHKENKTESQNSKTISLINVLNKKSNPVNNNISKTDTHIDKKLKTDDKSKVVTTPKINLAELLKPKENKPEMKELKTDIKSPKLQKEIKLTDLLNTTNDKVDKKQVKKVDNNLNDNINLQQSSVNEIKARSVQAKQTIESFKNNLDEAIKNYKPPISKVDIELNPKNLGKVEVSIVQRGNNIQVHMNTDQSNVAMFQNHQAEFRQALANIGFSNIDMSFNSNQEKERKQNQAKKTYEDNEKIEEIGDIEIKADYKYA